MKTNNSTFCHVITELREIDGEPLNHQLLATVRISEKEAQDLLEYYLEKRGKPPVIDTSELTFYFNAHKEDYMDMDPFHLGAVYTSDHEVCSERLHTMPVNISAVKSGKTAALRVIFLTLDAEGAEKHMVGLIGQEFFYHVFCKFPHMIPGYEESIPVEHAAAAAAEHLVCRDQPKFVKMVDKTTSIWQCGMVGFLVYQSEDWISLYVSEGADKHGNKIKTRCYSAFPRQMLDLLHISEEACPVEEVTCDDDDDWEEEEPVFSEDLEAILEGVSTQATMIAAQWYNDRYLPHMERCPWLDESESEADFLERFPTCIAGDFEALIRFEIAVVRERERPRINHILENAEEMGIPKEHVEMLVEGIALMDNASELVSRVIYDMARGRRVAMNSYASFSAKHGGTKDDYEAIVKIWNIMTWANTQTVLGSLATGNPAHN